MIRRHKPRMILSAIFAFLMVLLAGCSSIQGANNSNPSVSPQATHESSSPDTESMTTEEKVVYYIDKLKDQSFTGIYGDGFTWYTAAEELGTIGKPAIPALIEKLDTKDDYERTLALYALLLATQQENVKTFTNGEYINVNLDFDVDHHPDMVKTAMEWWDKYKSNY